MISDRVYIRSVLKNMRDGGEILAGPPDGSHGAVVTKAVSGNVVSSVKTGRYGLYAAYNELCAKGASPLFFNASILAPEGFDERQIKKLMQWLSDTGKSLGLAFGDCKVDVSARWRKLALDENRSSHDSNPQDEVLHLSQDNDGGCLEDFHLTISAVGLLSENECAGRARPGDDIVMTGVIGLDGIRRVVGHNPEPVRGRFSENFIREALGNEEELSVARAASLARTNGAQILQCAGDGGVFAALWYLSRKSGLGFDVDMKSIPVRQGIIELCEVYDINPYELSSLGCLLVTSSDGCGIVDDMESNGIRARVIGSMTDGKPKILRLGDETRFLDVPVSDESERFLVVDD